jgi:hypothetical protein
MMGIGLCMAAMLCAPVSAKKPKGPGANEGGAGTEAPAAGELNVASMRIAALDMLYQLDPSVSQLAAIKAAAAGAADATPRPAVKPDEKLADLFGKMQAAILTGTNDAQIAALRNQIVDAVNSGEIELTDTIRPTAAAHAAAAGICAKLKASQIAAFVAQHADEVGDPLEIMANALAVLRDSHATTQPAEEDAASLQETSNSIGTLVAGMDETKAQAVADQVAVWLKKGMALSDADYAAKQGTLEAEAKEIVTQAGPMDVLTHWMQEQVAVLLANPQTGQAITLMLTASQSTDARKGT